MNRAVDHAEKESPGWKDHCFELFKTWLSQFAVGEIIEIEFFRVWAIENGLEQPPSNNSFGHLPRKAFKSGLIKFAGNTRGKNQKSHAGLRCKWEKL
jgi:hypothetical protein